MIKGKKISKEKVEFLLNNLLNILLKLDGEDIIQLSVLSFADLTKNPTSLINLSSSLGSKIVLYSYYLVNSKVSSLEAKLFRHLSHRTFIKQINRKRHYTN